MERGSVIDAQLELEEFKHMKLETSYGVFYLDYNRWVKEREWYEKMKERYNPILKYPYTDKDANRHKS